jgi:hypothetical protein
MTARDGSPAGVPTPECTVDHVDKNVDGEKVRRVAVEPSSLGPAGHGDRLSGSPGWARSAPNATRLYGRDDSHGQPPAGPSGGPLAVPVAMVVIDD